MEAQNQYKENRIMRARKVNEGYGQKDLVRMQDIQTKSAGDHDKEISLATTQAKIIKNAQKAKARAEAAEEVFGVGSDIANIFNDRAVDLGGNYVQSSASRGALKSVTHAPKKGEKLEREFNTDFLLPSEKASQGKSTSAAPAKTFSRGSGGGSGFRRGGGGNTRQALGVGSQFSKDAEAEQRPPKRKGPGHILPIGVVNLGSGHSKYFNVKDNFEDGTAEVWKKMDPWGNQPKYRIVFSGGEYSVPGVIGDTRGFIHDQTWQDLGSYKLVDWVPTNKIHELVRVYGNSIAGAVYK